MANKALVLGAATVGGVMVYSGLAGVNVLDVLSGNASLKDANPKGGPGLPANLRSLLGGKAAPDAQSLVPLGKLGSVAGLTPEQIINSQVIPIAQKHGIKVTASSVKEANGRHGATITGGRSDHQGPPNERWAADMSNGQSPTPQMQALADELAQVFRINWDGAGAASAQWGGMRFQLIYRTMIGGNHFNHVHFGVAVK